MNDLLIIDGHAHTYDDTIASRVLASFTEYHRMEPTGSIGTGTVQDLLSRMSKNGIAWTVTANFAPRKSVERINAWSLKTAEEHKCFIPLVCVYPDMTSDDIRRYMAEGAKGIKMHTGIQGFEPDDPGLKDIYEYCERNRIPVTFHCGETSRVHMNEFSEMSHILPVLEKYPELPAVLTHLAAGEPDVVFQIAEKYPNALFDTSITFSGEHCILRMHNNFWEDDANAVRAFREIGCDRVTFGSDYPLANQESDIRRILRLSLTDEEKRMILGLNSRRLYFSGE